MTAVKQFTSNLWLDSWRKFKRDRPAVLGLVVVSIMAKLAIESMLKVLYMKQSV